MKFLIKIIDESVSHYYQTHKISFKGDAGLDLYASEDTTLGPHETKLVGLGIKSQLVSFEYNPLKWLSGSFYKYHSYLMFPRSSIYKTPLRLANSIGLIDSEYLGELKMAVTNISSTQYTVSKGTRLVQLVMPNLQNIKYEIVDELRNTDRNTGGFGSTGV